MKATVKLEALQTALKCIAGAVDKAAGQRFYDRVILDVAGKTLTLRATNLEVAISWQIPLDAKGEPGQAFVPFARLAPLVRAMPGETVDLTGDETNLTVRSEDSLFHIYGEDPESFPVLQPLPEAHVTVDGHVLAFAIHRTAFAAADAPGRYALNALLFVAEPAGNFHTVAADGSRLAIQKSRLQNPKNLDLSVLLPRKSAALLAGLAGEAEDLVRIGMAENVLVAAAGPWQFNTSTVEGSFPDYKAILATEHPIELTVPAEALLSAVTRARFITTEEERAVKFSIHDGQLTLDAESANVGQGSIWMDLDSTVDAEISFDPTLLEDALAGIGKNVKLSFTDAGTPARFSVGDIWTFVLSPIFNETEG